MSASKLPAEITESILRLLPVKSVCRFKSVSKTWNSLISDPHFIKTHLRYHMNHRQTRKIITSSNLFSCYIRSPYSVGINELVPYLNRDVIHVKAKKMIFRSHLNRRFQLLGSCNGLLLAKDETRAFFLTNPTTGEVWKVPELPFELPDEKSYAVYGFGYDSSTDDYKVVSLEFWDLGRHPSPPANTNTVVVTVYSLRSNSWRKLPDFPYGHADFNIRAGALINLNLHWLLSSSTIVTFNLADEQFGVLKLPDSFKKEETWISDVLDIGGKLGVFIKIDDIISEWWVMKEYGKSWTRVFSHEFKWNVWPACLVEESDRHVVLNSDHFESTIYVYNVDESRCSRVSIEGSLYDYDFIVEGTYVETLESPARFITSP